MVGTTTTVETVQETLVPECEALPQTGRIFLQGSTCKAEEAHDALIVRSDEPETPAHDIDAVVTEIVQCEQEVREEQAKEEQLQGLEIVGDSAATGIVHESPTVGHEPDVLLNASAAAVKPEHGIVQDFLITPNKPETSERETDALIIENIARKQEEEGQPGLDISQIRPKTYSERYTELIIQNLENERGFDITGDIFTRFRYSKSTKWNFVFNSWSLSKDNEVSYLCVFNGVDKQDSRGLAKFAGSGDGHAALWGETLADFFRVARLNSKVYSSSFLYNFVRSQGKDIPPFAKDLMTLAEKEDRPRVVTVYSFEQLIRNSEAWIRGQEDVVSWTRPGRPGEKIEGKERDPWEVPEPWPPESVFSPSAYPSPWPFEPFKKQWWHPQEKFSNFIHKPKLQQYIPQHLLPETLVVHDPYDILGARGNYFNGTPWIAKDDIARIYKLKPSNTKQPREIQDIKEYEEEITRVKDVREAFLAKPHSRTEMPDGMVYQSETTKDFQLGSCKPPVFIVFPSKPPQPPAKTAHLYVTPAARLGSGNHSYVYQAEFEVPRSFLVSEEICSECVLQDVKRILEEEDGPNGERRDARWDELSGRYTVKVRGTPARSVMLGDEVHKFKPDSRKVEVVYEGPYRAIETKVGYQNLERAPYCEHFRKDRIHPLTTKVQVAAKISMEDDDHLYYEENNYRAFPKDFFEHYNGFNLVRPLTEPTPVGAIVPQFYGYYVLDEDDERNKEWADDYLSPILLVEDCGTSIDPDDLSQDDTRECISLFYRMHAVDYYHGSAYRRNIVRQPGPLNEHPLVRQANATAAVPGTSRMGTNWSYRLIDFGRTRHKTKTDYDDYSWTMDWETGKMRSWLRGGTLS